MVEGLRLDCVAYKIEASAFSVGKQLGFRLQIAEDTAEVVDVKTAKLRSTEKRRQAT